MGTPTLAVTALAARRFMRRALLLDTPVATMSEALAHLGYIQIDPINVCGRMHDLIARNRIETYREGDLMRFLHGHGTTLGPGERKAFEHHIPGKGILVAFPLEAWPHLLAAMRKWSLGRGAWAGRLTPRERVLAQHLLAEIDARGPLGSEDFEDPRRAKKVWGEAKLVKATLQKLFFHGRVLIAQRVHNRRRYDLPHRVLPQSVLSQPEPPEPDTRRWLARLKLRQRRLATLTNEERRAIEAEIQPVRVPGCPLLYCLLQDAGLLEQTTREKDGGGNGAVKLLAPLDPLIYDRRVTAALWNFDYTWEAYTPPAKRVRGYYALPVLAGTELIGHIDAKADRTTGRLQVMGHAIERRIPRARLLREFASFLNVRMQAPLMRPR